MKLHVKTHSNGQTFVGFVILAFFAVLFIGYINNIVALAHHVSDPINLLIILRVMGIFAPPFGVILGLFF